MFKKIVLVLAVLTASGCGAQPHAQGAPVLGQTPSGAAPSAPSAPDAAPPRAVNPHITVVMPPGWTPVDLSKVPRGSFATSLNDELGARILITQGHVTGTAKEEANALADLLRKDGFICAATQSSGNEAVASFTVKRGGMRGKIAVRHFSAEAARIVVLGQWPADEEADTGGRKAVDAVIANAVYR